MSLGAEIFMRRAVAHLASGDGSDGVALLSRYGYASFGLEASAPVIRVALEPVGGLHLRPAAIYAPPARLGDEDAERILSAYPVVVDRRGGFPESGLGEQPSPALLRRSTAVDGDPPGMKLAFLDEPGGDVVYARNDLSFGDAASGLDPAASDFVDEFAAFPIDRRRATTLEKRFTRDGMEIGVAPAACLCEPAPDQIAAALMSGRAVTDEDGRIRLALPSFANAAAAFRVDVSANGSLTAKAGAGCSNLNVEPLSGGHAIRGAIAPGSEVAFVDVECQSLAEISAVWIAVTRRKGRWEVWDEADAHLQLEESW